MSTPITSATVANTTHITELDVVNYDNISSFISFVLSARNFSNNHLLALKGHFLHRTVFKKVDENNAYADPHYFRGKYR